MPDGKRPWHGGRILVAEDQPLFAGVVCDFLRHRQLDPVGPVASTEHGCTMARAAALDGAVLDLRLADDLSLPICRILAARRIPFLFLSAYSDLSMIPPEFREAPLVCKPFDSDEMTAALSLILDHDVAGRPMFWPSLSTWRN